MLFLLFLVILNNFFISPVDREKVVTMAKLVKKMVKIASAIRIRASTTLTDKKIQTPTIAALKTIKTLYM